MLRITDNIYDYKGHKIELDDICMYTTSPEGYTFSIVDRETTLSQDLDKAKRNIEGFIYKRSLSGIK